MELTTQGKNDNKGPIMVGRLKDKQLACFPVEGKGFGAYLLFPQNKFYLH